MPYFDKFRKSPFMFEVESGFFGGGGILAGFASVLKNREGLEDFWKTCVEYLVSRYYTSVDPESGKVKLSDEIFEELVLTKHNGKIIAKKIYGFGKDERMLFYGILPKYLPKIYFFDIRYFKWYSFYKDRTDLDFLEPTYPAKILEPYGEHEAERLTKYFTRFIKDYNKWLDKFKESYPTQKTYLEAVEENFQKRFVPIDAVLAQASKNVAPFEGHAQPYEEYAKYGRATMPGKLEGGRRTTRRGGRKGKGVRKTRARKGIR